MSCAPSAVLNQSFVDEGLLALDTPLPLAHSGTLSDACLAYRASGPADAPVVVVMGGISAHREADGTLGWWPEIVGPGRAVDHDRFRILGFDWLGGCGGSTRATGPKFPLIDSLDQAAATVHLLDYLGIDRLHAVIGASYGGQVAQQLLRHYPERVDRALVIGAADRPNPLAVALRGIQRRIVREGIESGRERRGLALARELAMIGYRSAEEFAGRFGAGAQASDGLRVEHPVQSYLSHCGQKFADRFEPWPYLRLSQSIDLHRVEPERIAAPFELIGFRSDLLVPPADLAAFAERAPACRGLTILDSPFGHDGFLKEAAQLGPIVRTFLETTPC